MPLALYKKQEVHVHDYKDSNKKTLLHKYRVEDGNINAVETVGYDILKQRKCKCGTTETYDLERTLT